MVLSVLGAYLAWTLMAAEMLFIPAKSEDMPRFLSRENAHGAPVPALLMAGGLVQLLLILLLFASNALDFMLDLTAALSLVPYLLAAGYALKLTITRETHEDRRPLVGDMVIAIVATIYTLFLLYAAGWDHLLLSCILYAPAAILYWMARRNVTFGLHPRRSCPFPRHRGRSGGRGGITCDRRDPDLGKEIDT